MDLAKDMLRLAEKVAHVPGLSTACSLAIQILQIVQISKQNTVRLHYLAHFIADYLVTISDNMQGMWDDSPDNLRGHIDEFEVILQDISKSVKNYSTSSPVLSLINAGDRNMDIARIERRLSDVQRSTLLLLGMDTSLAVNKLQTAVNQQQLVGLQTHSDLRHIQISLDYHAHTIYEKLSRIEGPQGLVNKLAAKDACPPSHYSDHNNSIYSRNEIKLVKRISRYSHYIRPSGTMMNITLYQAEHCTNGHLVLVKVYEGSSLDLKQTLMTEDLKCRERTWDPSILQIIRTSKCSENVFFHVFHAPCGHTMETFGDWYSRTLSSNPVETIFGLYNMRNSIKELYEFQKEQCVSCTSRILWNSVVNLQHRGNEPDWRLVYTGELRNSQIMHSLWAAQASAVYQRMPPMRASQRLHRVVSAFCAASEAWIKDTRPLEDVVKCGVEAMDFIGLSSALFESGWLGASSEFIQTTDIIGLGDVGYTNQDGHFIVVANLHSHLKATAGGLPAWESRRYWNHGSLPTNITTVETSGKYYKRYEIQQARTHWWRKFTVGYDDMDERHAWRALRKMSSEIISRNDLSIAPHELKLVLNTEKNMTIFYKQSEDSTESTLHRPIGQTLSRGHCMSSVSVHTNSKNHTDQPPIVYVFEEGNGTHLRDSGAPEIVARLDASFEAEPAWLHGQELNDREDWFENKDKFELKRTETYWISYLQLPIGISGVPCVQVREVK